MRIATVVAFAGAVGMAGAAWAKPFERERPIPQMHEGHPPPGIMRGDIMVRVAHDGRGDSADVRGKSVSDPSLRFSHQRPDSNVGQERHFALPIKSSVLLRVSMGDGAESARTASAQGKAMAQPKEARVYPGRHEHLPSPLPIKNDILMKVQGMQEASLGDQNNGRSLDDPKLSRGSHDHTAMKNAPAPRDARVYPGRHEHIPSVPEMFMTHGKTQSQSNDSPGDKDAA